MTTLATKLANDIHAAVLIKLAGVPMPTGNQAPMQQQATPVAPAPKPAPKPINAGALSPKAAPVAPGVSNGTATLPLKQPASPQAPKPNMGQRPLAMSAATANLLRSKGYAPNSFRQGSNGNWVSTPPQLIAGTRG